MGHNILDYTIGKGTVYIKTALDTERRLVGNCPEFEFTPELEKLEHFSSMSGTKDRDRTVIISKKGTLRIVFDEMSAENLRIALMSSTIENGSSGDKILDIFSASQINAEVWFEGLNDIGPHWNYYFPSVDFIPSQGISLISDEFMTVELNGDVQKSNNTFGTAQLVQAGA